MAQRVNIATAARLTGRPERTIRNWLAEDPCPFTQVEEGRPRGGRRDPNSGNVIKGRHRWLDVDELRRVNEERGGTEWHAEYLPTPDLAELAQQVATLTERLTALERLVADTQAQRIPRLDAPVARTGGRETAPAEEEGQNTASTEPEHDLPIVWPQRLAEPVATVAFVGRAPVPTRKLGERKRSPRPSRAKPPAPEGDAPPEVVEEVHALFAAGIRSVPPHLWEQLPRLRAGWAAFRTWCEDDHGLDARSVERDIYENANPEMPEPVRGAWRPRSGGIPILLAYSPAQQEQAAAIARRRWADRWRE